MELKQLEDHIKSFNKGHIFSFGLSKPFSWRGSYDEVAFSLIKADATREEILENIRIAYTHTFYGYKGGEYKYGDYTPVNFEEEGSRNYSDGEYTSRMIAEIEGNKAFISQEERLVNLAFK